MQNEAIIKHMELVVAKRTELEAKRTTFKDETAEKAENLVEAAWYADQLVSANGIQLNIYYVCQKQTPRCLLLMAAKEWRTKLPQTSDGAPVRKQRWYCQCGAYYQQGYDGYGMLVEIYDTADPGRVAYMRGQVNDLQKEMLAARAERRIYVKGMKPSDLFAAIEKKPPLLSNLVQPHSDAGNGYIKPDALQFADVEVWNNLQRLSWDQIIHYWQLFTPTATA